MSHRGLWSNVAREWYPWSVIRQSCHAADNGQMRQKNDAPRRRTLSHCGLQPNVVQTAPLIGGLCHAADFDQMWPKLCPSSQDFVTQQTLTKCGPKCVPHRRTLSRSGLWQNMAQIVPFVGGLCHAADFDQMWSKMCPLSEDFVMQRTLTKRGPNRAPHWRTLSCSGLWPNVVQNVPLGRRLCFAMEFNHIWIDNVLLIKKRPVPNKRILIIDQRGTETTVSNYVAMWLIC